MSPRPPVHSPDVHCPPTRCQHYAPGQGGPARTTRLRPAVREGTPGPGRQALGGPGAGEWPCRPVPTAMGLLFPFSPGAPRPFKGPALPLPLQAHPPRSKPLSLFASSAPDFLPAGPGPSLGDGGQCRLGSSHKDNLSGKRWMGPPAGAHLDPQGLTVSGGRGHDPQGVPRSQLLSEKTGGGQLLPPLQLPGGRKAGGEDNRPRPPRTAAREAEPRIQAGRVSRSVTSPSRGPTSTRAPRASRSYCDRTPRPSPPSWEGLHTRPRPGAGAETTPAPV